MVEEMDGRSRLNRLFEAEVRDVMGQFLRAKGNALRKNFRCSSDAANAEPGVEFWKFLSGTLEPLSSCVCLQDVLVYKGCKVRLQCNTIETDLKVSSKREFFNAMQSAPLPNSLDNFFSELIRGLGIAYPAVLQKYRIGGTEGRFGWSVGEMFLVMMSFNAMRLGIKKALLARVCEIWRVGKFSNVPISSGEFFHVASTVYSWLYVMDREIHREAVAVIQVDTSTLDLENASKSNAVSEKAQVEQTNLNKREAEELLSELEIELTQERKGVISEGLLNEGLVPGVEESKKLEVPSPVSSISSQPFHERIKKVTPFTKDCVDGTESVKSSHYGSKSSLTGSLGRSASSRPCARKFKCVEMNCHFIHTEEETTFRYSAYSIFPGRIWKYFKVIQCPEGNACADGPSRCLFAHETRDSYCSRCKKFGHLLSSHDDISVEEREYDEHVVAEILKEIARALSTSNCSDRYRCKSRARCEKGHNYLELAFFRSKSEFKMRDENRIKAVKCRGHECKLTQFLCPFAHGPRDAFCLTCQEWGHLQSQHE